MRQLKLSYWIGKLAVKYHYAHKLDIYALCSIHEPEKYSRSQRKAKIPNGIRWQVWRRDSFTCHYCGAVGDHLSLDHVVPECYGGKGIPENLVTACSKCNGAKSNRTYKEFINSKWLEKRRTKVQRTSTTMATVPPANLTQAQTS